MKPGSLTVYRWTEIPEDWVRPDFCRRVIHTENMTIAQIFLRKGSSVRLHKHDSEQVTYVMSGRLRFTFPDGKEVVVSEGEVIQIPPNLEHGAVALEDTVTLDMFSPPREDWRSGSDFYLRS